MYCESFLPWVVRRSLGYRPAREDAGHFEPQIVMQPSGIVLVHHESERLSPGPRARLGRRRFGSDLEIPFRLIFGQTLPDRAHARECASSADPEQCRRCAMRGAGWLVLPNYRLLGEPSAVLPVMDGSGGVVLWAVELCLLGRRERTAVRRAIRFGSFQPRGLSRSRRTIPGA